MEIKINTLTLRNFKGVREATFIFNGKATFSFGR